MEQPVSLADFGLDEPELLAEATQLAPQLFAALAVCRLVPDEFPIESDKTLERLLTQIVGADEKFSFPGGVEIAPQDARDHFPADFLPVTDRRDLVRKVFIAIARVHSAEDRKYRRRMDRGELKMSASHPVSPGEG